MTKAESNFLITSFTKKNLLGKSIKPDVVPNDDGNMVKKCRESFFNTYPFMSISPAF
jgi:hypothetical protein